MDMPAYKLHFRHLTEIEIENVYNTEMKTDFQPDELKPLSMIQEALSHGEYDAYGILAEDSNRIGYAFILKLPDVQLLDYFAISAMHRGKGYGTASLRILSEMCRDELLLIETENPDYISDEMTCRRLQFYLRYGCRDTGVRAEIWGVPYRVLMLAGKYAEKVRITIQK